MFRWKNWNRELRENMAYNFTENKNTIQHRSLYLTDYSVLELTDYWWHDLIDYWESWTRWVQNSNSIVIAACNAKYKYLNNELQTRNYHVCVSLLIYKHSNAVGACNILLSLKNVTYYGNTPGGRAASGFVPTLMEGF